MLKLSRYSSVYYEKVRKVWLWATAFFLFNHYWGHYSALVDGSLVLRVSISLFATNIVFWKSAESLLPVDDHYFSRVFGGTNYGTFYTPDLVKLLKNTNTAAGSMIAKNFSKLAGLTFGFGSVLLVLLICNLCAPKKYTFIFSGVFALITLITPVMVRSLLFKILTVKLDMLDVEVVPIFQNITNVKLIPGMSTNLGNLIILFVFVADLLCYYYVWKKERAFENYKHDYELESPLLEPGMMKSGYYYENNGHMNEGAAASNYYGSSDHNQSYGTYVRCGVSRANRPLVSSEYAGTNIINTRPEKRVLPQSAVHHHAQTGYVQQTSVNTSNGHATNESSVVYKDLYIGHLIEPDN